MAFYTKQNWELFLMGITRGLYIYNLQYIRASKGSVLERPSTKQYKTVLECICARSPLFDLRVDSSSGATPLLESGLRPKKR